MEFIFELFAELLGRADGGMMDSTPAKNAEQQGASVAQEQESDASTETGLQDVNIFNVVNFH